MFSLFKSNFLIKNFKHLCGKFLSPFILLKDSSFIKGVVGEFEKRVSRQALERLFYEAAMSIGLKNVFLFKPENPSFIMEGEKTKVIKQT